MFQAGINSVFDLEIAARNQFLRFSLVTIMQAAFHVFGMELLATLDLAHTNAFFDTFFRLPDFYWRGFLSSSLTSSQLIVFALLTYVLAPLSIKWALMRHLITSPAGGYLMRAYLGRLAALHSLSVRPCCCLSARQLILILD